MNFLVSPNARRLRLPLGETRRGSGFTATRQGTWWILEETVEADRVDRCDLGLWRSVPDGAGERRLFEVPWTALLEAGDTRSNGRREPVEAIEACQVWAEAAAAGALPPGWPLPHARRWRPGSIPNPGP